MLDLTDVHKSFWQSSREIEILKGIQLSVKPAETVAITGASGVGKSTLLHIMGSLDPPTKGKVLFEGEDLYALPTKELERIRNRKLGFVFQFHYLLPEFNALENIMLPLLIGKIEPREARAHALEALEMVGLIDKASLRPGQLSGGEQQRVAIARAIALKPRILLADEPTGNLDWETGEEISELFLRLNQEFNMALVIVTHNLRLAARMARRMEIVHGKIQEVS